MTDPQPIASLPPVAFVGAGPAAAEHLTLGALRLLQAADVLARDRLVGDEVLALLPDPVARIDMGKIAARFMQGRMLRHGDDAATPVTVAESLPRRDERGIRATLSTICDAVAAIDGPAVLLYGLAPRQATSRLTERKEARA